LLATKINDRKRSLFKSSLIPKMNITGYELGTGSDGEMDVWIGSSRNKPGKKECAITQDTSATDDVERGDVCD
jgi:hypothetical protein